MESVSYSRRARNPKENASFISSLFFWWTYRVLKKGQSKAYDVEDLPSPLQKDNAHNLGNRMEKLWLEEVGSSIERGKKSNLFKIIVKTFWKELIFSSFLYIFSEIFVGIATQVFLGYFLYCLKKTDAETLVYAGILLILFNGMNNLSRSHVYSINSHIGFRINVALSSLVYRKCLRLGQNVSENTSAGLVVNLLSNDMRQFDYIVNYCNFLWSGVLTAAFILAVVWYIIGIQPTMALLLMLSLIMPLQIIISKALARNRIRTAYASDKRIQIMDEVICGIQIIKMYAWEKPFQLLIKQLRKVEIKLLRKNLYLRGFQMGISMSLQKVSMYLLITVYALIGGSVIPEKVFTLMGCCAILARTVCANWFRSFGECSQCYVSVKRIQHFLELKEFKKPNINNLAVDEHAIKFDDVKASWTLDSNRDTLKDICLTIKKDELTTVVGQVGSGKSSILNILLGELPITGGKLSICGSVSYYGQVPWIFAGTIRQNILFTEVFEKSRYDRVIEVCALQKDFQYLHRGDLTLIGERGVTLSGGQKSRIALARAVYKNADIYLLDDPLSAVDINISKQIFQECILGFLKNKTRLLVTHQLYCLADSDQIVLLHEGIVDAKGTYQEIVTSKANYLNMLKKPGTSNEHEPKQKYIQIFEGPERDSDMIPGRSSNEKKELEKEDNEETNSHALTEYLIKGAGLRGVLTVIFLSIMTQVAFSAFEIWLSLWTHYTESNSKNNTNIQNTWSFVPFESSPLVFFIIGYSVIIICAVIFCIFRNTCYAHYANKCSKRIHDDSVQGVIYTDPSFFHNNPPGRILNRFSKDLGIVDSPLLLCLLDATTTVTPLVASFIIISLIDIVFVIPALVVLISLLLIRRFYLKTSVNLKRLENITKSPVFVHLHTTLQGLPVIRACLAADKFTEQFDQYQDLHTSAWYLYTFTATGYSYWLEALCFMYMAAIVISSFFLKLTGSEIGLALAQVSVLLNFIAWSMKQSAEVSNQVTSVDRLLKYSGLRPEHQPLDDDVNTKNWPSDGKISFENVSLQYNISSASSIYGVSFTVNPREKVGIVGRTGAGKSSLLSALFRLGFVKGTIKIDDVDTSTVRLEKLRSKISVIPQDPVLFSGTMRKNLDPFDEYSDRDLWDALAQAELKNTILKSDDAGLNSLVSEGGKNFSVGERQLICLARAILRNNKILVLDEATANVDQQTDSIIQKTIREKFESCTVLTIAHRLNTIADSDKILVMDGGTIVEYDHPYKLLLDLDSIFYKLVSNTGEFMAAALTGIAKENYDYNQKKIKDEGKNTN